MFQRKKPAMRAFTGLAGSPLARAKKQPGQADQAAQAAQAIQDVFTAVAAAKTNEEIKSALTENLLPRRGRKRKWTNDAERKRTRRAEERQKLEQLLGHFGVSLDSEIDPELRDKYKIEAKTYREFLTSDRIKLKLVRAVADAIKQKQKEERQDQQSTGDGKFMRAAPQGKGLLITGGYDSEHIETVIGVRESEARALSGDQFDLTMIGDRRRGRPKGHGPDPDDAE